MLKWSAPSIGKSLPGARNRGLSPICSRFLRMPSFRAARRPHLRLVRRLRAPILRLPSSASILGERIGQQLRHVLEDAAAERDHAPARVRGQDHVARLLSAARKSDRGRLDLIGGSVGRVKLADEIIETISAKKRKRAAATRSSDLNLLLPGRNTSSRAK